MLAAGQVAAPFEATANDGGAVSLASFTGQTLVGFFSAHDMTTNVEYVNATPDHQRGQMLGLAQAALRGAQGLGVLVTGLLAELLDPARVIALTAVIGVAAALLAARAWRRASPGPPSSAAAPTTSRTVATGSA